MKITTVIASATAAILLTAGGAAASQLISGAQIADGTITAADIDPGVLDDVAGNDPVYQHRTVTVPVYTEDDSDTGFVITTIAIRCPEGTRGINGGLQTDSPSAVETSYPARNGWVLKVVNTDQHNVDKVMAYAVCI